MRTVFGMILGAFLTIAGAYFYDSMRTSSVATGDAASGYRPMVNWDVVSENWRTVKSRAQVEWNKLAG